ncbi:cytidylyltransferase domain-containing protein [Microbacterium hydrocarbonoxydans]|uniref:Spore coat polysaccharide biosynthesis protein SpsF n=1 Tax=Microbacterium hydrocarbonoxydans TaxID=273678 RepID=A0A1H4NN71_9MICO|nr:glycosyltransferase family protein [Microbacterium hydrocarbonoxydans]SEB96288.1 spore coat polysaccharide biosynthesis protein SpsF [Microbacterium hydrocarbonoxydans]
MVLAILQARTSSHRLPGKVLSPILGTPLILRALERISRSALIDRIVLATSDDPSDDALARVVSDAGYVVQRGPLDDVLTRFIQVLDRFDDETVVRLTGDNVLCDPRVIDEVISAHLDGGADYTANTLQRTYPRGLDVEVFRADALRAVDGSAVAADEREHVTLGIYRRPELFRLRSVTQPIDRSELRWTVDHPADLEFARTVYSHLHDTDAAFGQEQVVGLLETHPDLVLREQDVS